ncbi:MAG TPA: hypothetical protein VHN20_02790 [Beijerinckiaceae bacterium]|nr:hypothetical protein [Beijerinckiaceae bacterium]
MASGRAGNSHGGMLAPGLLDRLLARRAWEGRMTPEPAPPFRGDNLEGPPAGDPGSRGRFTAVAHDHAVAAREHLVRGILAAAAAGFVAAAALVTRAATITRRRRPK